MAANEPKIHLGTVFLRPACAVASGNAAIDEWTGLLQFALSFQRGIP